MKGVGKAQRFLLSPKRYRAWILFTILCLCLAGFDLNFKKIMCSHGWVPIQTAMLESQFRSLDFSFSICKMEVEVEGLLQLLTITAVEITSANTVCWALY